MASVNSPKFEVIIAGGPKHKPNTSHQRAPAQATKQTIAFVNLTDSSGPTQDAAKRKLVRAHVMKGYQRQKQAQEAEEYDKFQLQQYIDTKIPPSTITPLPEPENIAVDVDSTLSLPSDDLDWTATLDIRPLQQRSENAREIGPRREGEWFPDEEFGSDGILHKMPAIELNTERDHYMFNELLDIQQDMNNIYSNDNSDFFEQPAMEPEEIECPLITQSLTLTLSFNALNTGMLDPFNAMPGLKNARAQALMYHYNKVLVNTLIPVNPKDKWFNYAISDEALFHATMLHSAGHNAMLAGNHDLADPFQLKLEAIRLVNRRLNDPRRSISDLTIGAVACLVLFENQAGNVEVSNIHMAGLHRMIALRGGIHSLGLSGVLQRKVLWADVCNAMISHSAPRYNLPSDATTLALNSATNPANMRPAYASSTMTLASHGSCNCDSELGEIIRDLRTLSQQPPINALDGAITDHLYLVERHLVSLINSSSSTANSPRCNAVIRPFLIAAIIYIYIFLRDFPLQAPLFDALITRLSGALFQITSTAHVWEESSYFMLLWVLAVGAMASRERKERSQFVAELEAISGMLGMSTFVGFMGALGRIVWSRRSMDVLKEVWGEVLELRQRGMVDISGTGSYSGVVGEF